MFLAVYNKPYWDEKGIYKVGVVDSSGKRIIVEIPGSYPFSELVVGDVITENTLEVDGIKLFKE